jgi:hypothetical protein
MTRTSDELLAEALKLPEPVRARIAQSLLASPDDSADDGDPVEIEQAWVAEVSRRAAEIDAGTVQTIPATEPLFDARAKEVRPLRNDEIRVNAQIRSRLLLC